MREAILAGRKVATSRPHPLPLERVQAVSGSRFDAKVFAVLEIADRIPSTWRTIIRMFYREEGFGSPEEMQAYGVKQGLVKNLDDPAFFHRFKLVEAVKVACAPRKLSRREVSARRHPHHP